MELVQNTTQNGETELEMLIADYGDRLLRYATSILYNHQDAEDIVQDVFISYLHNASRFEIRNLSAWLHKITYNQCLNKLKAVKRRRLLFWEDVKTEPHVHMEDNLTMPEIMRALSPLKPQERALLCGRIINGQSYEELSHIMGLTPAALRKQYERVKKKAAKYLDAHGFSPEGQKARSLIL